MIAALFSVLLFAAETPATTAETASDPTQATTPANTAGKDKKICRIDPAHTGTRMAKKLCLTQTEWDMKARGKNAGDLKTIGGR
jgi:hypothetical protein